MIKSMTSGYQLSFWISPLRIQPCWRFPTLSCLCLSCDQWLLWNSTGLQATGNLEGRKRSCWKAQGFQGIVPGNWEEGWVYIMSHDSLVWHLTRCGWGISVAFLEGQPMTCAPFSLKWLSSIPLVLFKRCCLTSPPAQLNYRFPERPPWTPTVSRYIWH